MSVTRVDDHGVDESVLDSHWSVARWPDATPAFLLTVRSLVPCAPAPLPPLEE